MISNYFVNKAFPASFLQAAAFAVLCLLSFGTLAAPMLQGKMEQGALIRGKIAPGGQVWLNDKPLAVTPNGEFVFGFGRDAEANHLLKYKLPNEENSQSMPLEIAKREYDIDYIEGVEQKYVSPPKDVLERIRKDNRQVAAARRTSSTLMDFLDDFIMPAEGRISGVYGSQRVFNGQPRRPHFGLDVANKVGTPVVAPVGGVVTLVVPDMYYSGGTLIIDHGFGISSTFIHLDKIHVEVGQRVDKGQLIAAIGATGRVTGPHLDWRINWYSTRLDPASVLQDGN